MTTVNEVRDAVYKHLINNWENDRYVFDNQRRPEYVDQSWLRLVMRIRTSQQDTLGKPGNRQYERRGAVLIQLFTPANTGTQESDRLSNELQDLFEGVNVGPANFYEATAREIGPSEEWYQVNIEALFVYNSMK